MGTHFKSTWVKGLKRSLLALTLVFVGFALYRSVLNADWSLVEVRPGRLFLGFLLIAVSTVVGSWILGYIYRNLGLQLTPCQALELLTVPALGKYVPGKFLSIAGHAAMALSFGIPLPAGTVAVGVATSIGLAASTLLGLLVFLLSPDSFQGLVRIGWPEWGILLALLFLVLCPGLYRQVLQFFLRIFKHPPLPFHLSFGTLALLLTTNMLQAGLHVTGFAFVVTGMLHLPVHALPTIGGALCLANVVGFLALFAPGGIGVREGILLLLLSPSLGDAPAGFVAVATRLIQVAADLLAASMGATVAGVERRRNERSDPAQAPMQAGRTGKPPRA